MLLESRTDPYRELRRQPPTVYASAQGSFAIFAPLGREKSELLACDE